MGASEIWKHHKPWSIRWLRVIFIINQGFTSGLWQKNGGVKMIQKSGEADVNTVKWIKNLRSFNYR